MRRTLRVGTVIAVRGFAGVNVRFMRDNNINGYTPLPFANALRARIAVQLINRTTFTRSRKSLMWRRKRPRGGNMYVVRGFYPYCVRTRRNPASVRKAPETAGGGGTRVVVLKIHKYCDRDTVSSRKPRFVRLPPAGSALRKTIRAVPFIASCLCAGEYAATWLIRRTRANAVECGHRQTGEATLGVDGRLENGRQQTRNRRITNRVSRRESMRNTRPESSAMERKWC